MKPIQINREWSIVEISIKNGIWRLAFSNGVKFIRSKFDPNNRVLENNAPTNQIDFDLLQKILSFIPSLHLN